MSADCASHRDSSGDACDRIPLARGSSSASRALRRELSFGKWYVREFDFLGRHLKQLMLIKAFLVAATPVCATDCKSVFEITFSRNDFSVIRS